MDDIERNNLQADREIFSGTVREITGTADSIADEIKYERMS